MTEISSAKMERHINFRKAYGNSGVMKGMDVDPNKEMSHNHPFQDMRCGLCGSREEEISY